MSQKGQKGRSGASSTWPFFSSFFISALHKMRTASTGVLICAFAAADAFLSTPAYCPSPTHLSLSASNQDGQDVPSRRGFLTSATAAALAAAVSSQAVVPASPAIAATGASTADAKVTDRVYIDVKGLVDPGEDPVYASPKRLVIGLFGEDAPQAVGILKQLVSKQGLPADCKPKESRTLQREQLEANKVYNSCVELVEKGVNYDLSTVWRIDKDNRIDLGSIQGKYISRIPPTFEESNSGLKHDVLGVVSVRRGNDGGFGFTIYPGGGDPSLLDEEHVVVGRVLEGMEYVKAINVLPVVQSSSVGYKAGGSKAKTAPSRACRYGSSELYCNELKPLKKLQISATGVL